MITVKLKGGLGNQMFQYAFGKKIAKERGAFLVLDLSDYGISNRVFSLDMLNVKYLGSIRSRVVSKIIDKVFSYKSFIDLSPGGENSLRVNLSEKSIFSGYWESVKHFEPILSTIRREFTLKNRSDAYINCASSISRNASISIHVRRGDYLIPHGKYLQSKEYFRKGVEKIVALGNFKDPQIIIFSDDPRWCKEELGEIAGIRAEIFKDRDINDVEEMFLMSECTHNIISNSTFSWWAAFLNKNPNKIVAAPKNWFTDGVSNRKQIENLMLKSWVLI